MCLFFKIKNIKMRIKRDLSHFLLSFQVEKGLFTFGFKIDKVAKMALES